MDLGVGTPTGSSEAEANSVPGRGSFNRRTLLAGSVAAAAGAAASLLGDTAQAAGPLSVFEPMVPSLRLADTRPGKRFGFSRPASGTIRVSVAGRTVDGVTIPADATAAVLTVVAISLESTRGWITTYPAKTVRPSTSSLNYAGLRDTINNLVTLKLGSGGAIDIHASSKVELVVDLVGVYRPSGGFTRAGRFEPLGGLSGTGPAARRIYSEKIGRAPRDGDVIDVDVSGLISEGLVEPDAQSIVANLTIVRPRGWGWAAAYPYGESRPRTSSLNYDANTIRAVSSIIRLGTHPRTGRRGFHVYFSRGAPRFLADATGYFTGPAARHRTDAGQFVPLQPQRILDTRRPEAWLRGVGGKKRLFPGWTRQFLLPSGIRSSAGSAVVNLTMAQTMERGWLTLHPARGPRDSTSNVNVAQAGQIASNHAITPVGKDGLMVFSSHGGSVICDLVGYFKGEPRPATVPVVPDPPPPPIKAPYTLRVPRIGRTLTVDNGPAWIVDTGKIWHWTGTGMVGQGAMIGAFGHRTDAGGPLRNIHWLREGDVVTLDTSDRRRYHYRYVGRELTNSSNSRILEAAARHPGEVLALVACTVGYDRAKGYPNVSAWAPTSLKYRIIVRLELMKWDDIS